VPRPKASILAESDDANLLVGERSQRDFYRGRTLIWPNTRHSIGPPSADADAASSSDDDEDDDASHVNDHIIDVQQKFKDRGEWITSAMYIERILNRRMCILFITCEMSRGFTMLELKFGVLKTTTTTTTAAATEHHHHQHNNINQQQHAT
jgi:hypothetical protein